MSWRAAKRSGSLATKATYVDATGCRWRRATLRALDQIRAAGGKILSVTQVKATLEEYFMNLVEADRAQAAAVEVSAQ